MHARFPKGSFFLPQPNISLEAAFPCTWFLFYSQLAGCLLFVISKINTIFQKKYHRTGTHMENAVADWLKIVFRHVRPVGTCLFSCEYAGDPLACPSATPARPEHWNGLCLGVRARDRLQVRYARDHSSGMPAARLEHWRPLTLHKTTVHKERMSE
jgi:hypothetical protein